VLGPSTTQLFRNVSNTLRFQEGDELVLSKIEHEANLASWLDLAERQHLVLKWWLPHGEHDAKGSSPKLRVHELQSLLSDRTRFVALTHASNVLGTINDVKTIARAVHERTPKALVCVDGVAYAPHRQIDVKDLGVDIYAFSWYKVRGDCIRSISKLKCANPYILPRSTARTWPCSMQVRTPDNK
jgi:selenocysteine lyase/cysteine desulfurase